MIAQEIMKMRWQLAQHEKYPQKVQMSISTLIELIAESGESTGLLCYENNGKPQYKIFDMEIELRSDMPNDTKLIVS